MRVRIDGPQTPKGTVAVSGAKNSATRILATALLASDPVTLRNFPTELEDVKAKAKFIRMLGAVCDMHSNESTAQIHASDLNFHQLETFELPVRTTYLLAAAGLLYNSLAKVPYPGGCKIGSRGYDLHVMVWQRLGCNVTELENYIEVSGTLKGGDIEFPISTVGGTENALICASIANGDSIIRNAYVTPEVSDLIAFLRELGAMITLEGNSLIRVKGAAGALGSTTFSIMPDRIEALTWMILAAASGANLMIENVPYSTLEVPLIHLREAGIDIFRNERSALVTPASVGADGIQPFELACGTHPGIHTDMQSFFVFLALFAKGRSVIHDFRYPNRIGYAEQLENLVPGRIQAVPGRIEVLPGPPPVAGRVTSTDLRSSMALLMTALCAEGTSEVNKVELALRGYNNLPRKLKNLGITSEWI